MNKEKKKNWWAETKRLNELDYKENFDGICQHRDKAIHSGIIECRSCGYSEGWNPKDYKFGFERK